MPGTQIGPVQASISPVFNFASLVRALALSLSLPSSLSLSLSAPVYARTPCRKLGVPRGQRGHFKKYLRSAGCDGSANSYLFFTAQRQPLLYLHRSSPAPAQGIRGGWIEFATSKAIFMLYGIKVEKVVGRVASRLMKTIFLTDDSRTVCAYCVLVPFWNLSLHPIR